MRPHVVRVPETLEPAVAPASVLFEGEEDHDTEADVHDPSSHAWSGCKVGEEEALYTSARARDEIRGRRPLTRWR